MAGYCGKCQTYYNCHYTEHDFECEGEPRRIEQGSEEDFENQRRINNWDDEQAEEVWEEHYRHSV